MGYLYAVNSQRNWEADAVINASEENPVEAVHRLTDGKGADLVVDCVGGHAGVKSFDQAQDMVRRGGTLQLIALYQGEPLPLHSSKIMSKRLVAGILIDEPLSQTAVRALEQIRTGKNPNQSDDHPPLSIRAGKGGV